MKNEFEHIDDLVAKVLAGEANSEEKKFLDDWALISEENRSYVSDAKKLFEQIAAIDDKPVNVNEAWGKVNERINGNGTKVMELPKRNRNLRIAAAVVLLICMSFFLKMLLSTKETEPQFYAAAKQAVETKLPDGSKVLINKNSEISYTIKDDLREVKLKGEAYFEVVHNDAQPFVIDVEGVLIKDIGTEFNVRTLPGGDIVEVKVDGGEVQFYTENNEGLKLIKGEKAHYSKTSKKFTKVSTDMFDNTSSYRSKIFNFKKTQLKEVIDLLNEVYMTDIRIGDSKLANCPYTGSFNNESVERIVEILQATFDLNVEKVDGAYILNGGECLNM